MLHVTIIIHNPRLWSVVLLIGTSSSTYRAFESVIFNVLSEIYQTNWPVDNNVYDVCIN